MKRLLAMALVLAMMAMCLAACGSKKKENAVELDKPAYERGKVEGSNWSSEWIGLAFEGGSDFVMSTDEELHSLMEQAGQMFDLSNIDYSALVNVYEMMAVSLTGDNVVVATEKLQLSNMTLDQYITAFKAQMEVMYGDAVEVVNSESYTLAGIEFTKLESIMSVNGISVSQVYLLKKVEDRIVILTFSEIADGGFEKMAAKFSAYKG